MFKQIVFHSDVAEDIKGAYLWYEKQLNRKNKSKNLEFQKALLNQNHKKALEV
ncbi:hypothetical protein [Aliarcobacter vitoriensis]|uniref:hypothetical protein n=1 Tax=Aliarcobacter vitoriensis TaxID=2011099 RepID=UPI001C9C1C07|nr:hypothetical protein [Aliarcobacter vitoriensis]